MTVSPRGPIYSQRVEASDTLSYPSPGKRLSTYLLLRLPLWGVFTLQWWSYVKCSGNEKQVKGSFKAQCVDYRNKSLLFWAQDRNSTHVYGKQKCNMEKEIQGFFWEMLGSAVAPGFAVPLSFGSPSPGAGLRRGSQDMLGPCPGLWNGAPDRAPTCKKHVSASSCPNPPCIAMALE